MDDNWDLQAVVRGCCSSTSAAAASSAVSYFTSAAQSYLVSFSSEQSCSLSQMDPFETRNVIGELDDLYKPFFPKSSSSSSSSRSPLYTPVSAPAVSSSPASFSVSKEARPKQSKQAICTRSKRRKNQLKKICQVPAEAVSSDVWAWRKYGQKPIKGSPYPRGYYRCSSSKGCLARKQVERNRSDPGVFIVTYTGEHNHPVPTHRNSLAGGTRQKTNTNLPSPAKVTCSSSPSTSLDEELIPRTTSTESRDQKYTMEEDEKDEEYGGFSEMAVNDDFFAGLEELTPSTAVDCFVFDHFPAKFGLSSLVNTAAAAASGI